MSRRDIARTSEPPQILQVPTSIQRLGIHEYTYSERWCFGITGTNGERSVFIYQVGWMHPDHKCFPRIHGGTGTSGLRAGSGEDPDDPVAVTRAAFAQQRSTNAGNSETTQYAINTPAKPTKSDTDMDLDSPTAWDRGDQAEDAMRRLRGPTN